MEEFKEEKKEETTEKVKKVKHKYCTAPCPDYDIVGTEQWLEEMAEKGWLLEKDGQWLGWFDFAVCEKKKVRYRIQVTECRDEPDDEAVELAEKYGWDYVTRRGDFYIWRSEDENARELNTDSELQAMMVNLLRKRQRREVIEVILSVLFYFLVVFRGMILLPMIRFGTWVVLLALLGFGWEFVHSVKKVINLGRIRKQLLLGETPESTYPWREKANRHRITNVLRGVMALVAFVFFVYVYVLHDMGTWPSHAKSSRETLPFATVMDFVAEGGTRTTFPLESTETEEWSDLLAPVNISRHEHIAVTDAEGVYRSLTLDVAYHEMRFSWLAKWLAKEYRRFDQTVSLQGRKAYKELDPNGVFSEFDYAVVYETIGMYSKEDLEVMNAELYGVVLVKDTIAVHVMLKLPLIGEAVAEDWLKIIADSIQKR